jgi:hypothetical protein
MDSRNRKLDNRPEFQRILGGRELQPLKLQPKNADRVPKQLRRVDGECQHVQGMRYDDKSHALWLCGYILDGIDIVVRQCDECAAQMEGFAELDWRIPYTLLTEEDAKHKYRTNPNIVALSERAKRLQRAALEDEDKKKA